MHHHASQNLQVWHICLGTAMGNPPAQLYFLIHELNFVHTYPQLCHYVRYLDDIFLIWNPDPNPIKDESDWAKFQIASMHSEIFAGISTTCVMRLLLGS